MGFKKSGAGCASGEILRASGRIALRGRFSYANMGGSINGGTPNLVGLYLMEDRIEMDKIGVPLF